MSALDRLAEIEVRLNHEPCCEHVGSEYNCSDCRNTGCAHAPYIDNEHALADMAALAAALRAVLALHTPKPDQFIEFEPHCAGCETVSTFTYYPCPTVTAITEALGGAR